MREDGGPAMAPLNVVVALRGEERWRHFDDSVNAVSFGFVATAVLISMFLVMAIFERFLRSRSPLAEDGRGGGAGNDFRVQMGSSADLEAHAGKMEYSSPKISMYSKEVSVLMPGHSTPTFIACPAPAPCPPERMAWPAHEHCSISEASLVQQTT
ncbi:uncharacterized protein LOC121967266 [Zingiber officinale]|uniref:Uncharacterized protein n=1 Tax=Zingiber officinale TaxID=94328 RepID=A0A8J5LK73_ZINOF|nr:uncharacterized protein LOC121967266 [Zingiber officinale]KAG6519048.1 hypothetical protein ZIOFF_022537 [Zingiber officinale]